MLNQMGRFRIYQGKDISLDIHFVLVVAVDIERDAVLKAMKPLSDEEKILKILDEESVYFAGKLGVYNCILVMCQMGTIGRDSSILATSNALKRWNPDGGVIMPGIAFGKNPEKQVLGDVIVATQIIAYEPARMSLSEKVSRGAHPETSLTLLNRLRNLEWTWSYNDIDNGETSSRGLLYGPLLSGEKLVDNPDYKASLFNEFPKAIGGEMEGVGVYAAASREGVSWIVVKAICDWGDGEKSKEFQPLAADNSVAAIKTMLEEPGLADTGRALTGGTTLLRSRLESIRRHSELRQAKSEALYKLIATMHRDENGNPMAAVSLQPMLENMEMERDVAIENWLNEYELACCEFLTKKVNSADFRQQLGQEIKELVENDGPQMERLFPMESSPYPNIHAAYENLFRSNVADGSK